MEKSSITAFITRVKQEEETNPLIMGILNLTPDSFYDGGSYLSEREYLPRVEQMLSEGADIIDLGAVSTRPGAKELSQEEEWGRLKTALEKILKQFPSVTLSVDTWRAEVARRAIDKGVALINDISGGTMDPGMFEVISHSSVAYILMHMVGTPETMQQNIHYTNVTRQVSDFFIQRTEMLEKRGVEQIILDPGFGFGKTIHHNYKLLSELQALRVKNYPLLVGISRKSMIYKALKTTPQESLTGTTVLNTLALLHGADILRVHDVREAKEAVTLTTRFQQTAKQTI
ncbi:MAG: dihydropteroate synthase [Bacteroidetes bacterium]|nr:MAG: dihydropteroate synthase [Bacteroidota bacterium]